jgi:ATP-binding cassette subfamily A (ABC1) protein 3
LLGHNGAGKTTTISLLTGLIEKDQGTIRFYGRSIDESLDEVRKYTGICPQRDVLYEELSIEEHLQFYARVKGVPEEAIEREVD